MLDTSSILPTTALVAVVIFVLKEIIETIRRWRGDQRRRRAYCELLARECELNNWVVRSLRGIAEDLRSSPHNLGHEVLQIEFAKSGRIYACVDSVASGNYTKTAVPSVHSDVMRKHLVDIATLDKKLFKLVEDALTASAQLEHVRESLVYHGSSEDEVAKDHLASFGDYAVREVDKAFAAIAALYVACEGKQLSEVRLR